MSTLDFIHDIQWSDLPKEIRHQTKRCLLDLVGIWIGGSSTRLSSLIRGHASRQFGGSIAMSFDGRNTSAVGYALAGGMTIDALDGHDGYNPAKGHVGCGLLPATLSLAQEARKTDGQEFLATLAMGYELGSRLGPALHATTPDYHTSGAWIAVAAAASGARLLGLNAKQTAHALGIAEYHGPRSQMMRCIDHPTMLKDGSGWGAMAGVSSALLAQVGFTGAPALTITKPQALWADLGSNWLIAQQYFKPYPVCRWAQAPVEASLALCAKHALTGKDIAHVKIATFHESTRLATTQPSTTEEAQYSTSFPVAVALARGRISAADLTDPALSDPEILRLSLATSMAEDSFANEHFPAKRLARVTLITHSGDRFESGWTTPKWDASDPPSDFELSKKFYDLTDNLIAPTRAAALESAINLVDVDGIRPLLDLMCQPIKSETSFGKAS